MSGVEGPSPRLSLGDSKGVFSSEREYPLWCRRPHAAFSLRALRGKQPLPRGNAKKKQPFGRLRIRKHAVLPAPFWLKYNRKNLPIRQYGEIFSADFISKIHWQNCFAPKKSKFCAELRRDGAGMLTHGKTAQRRSPCKSCLLRRMFSYAESAKAALLGAKGMLCYGSGISLLSKSVLSSIEVRESPNFLMRERSWSSCCVSRTAKRSSALNSPTT